MRLQILTSVSWYNNIYIFGPVPSRRANDTQPQSTRSYKVELQLVKKCMTLFEQQQNGKMRSGVRLLLLRQFLALDLSPFAAMLNATLGESLPFLGACLEWHACAILVLVFFQSLARAKSSLKLLSECGAYVSASPQGNSRRRINNVDELDDVRRNGFPVSKQETKQRTSGTKSKDIYRFMMSNLFNLRLVMPLREVELLVVDENILIKIPLRSTCKPHDMQEDEK